MYNKLKYYPSIASQLYSLVFITWQPSPNGVSFFTECESNEVAKGILKKHLFSCFEGNYFCEVELAYIILILGKKSLPIVSFIKSLNFSECVFVPVFLSLRCGKQMLRSFFPFTRSLKFLISNWIPVFSLKTLLNKL